MAEAMDSNMTGLTDEVKKRVIIPPPEIKAVVDKTAAYVAKNGS